MVFTLYLFCVCYKIHGSLTKTCVCVCVHIVFIVNVNYTQSILCLMVV